MEPTFDIVIEPRAQHRGLALLLAMRHVVRRMVNWTCTIAIPLLGIVGVMTLVAPTSFICSYHPGACTTRAAAEAAGQTPRLIAPADEIGDTGAGQQRAPDSKPRPAP